MNFVKTQDNCVAEKFRDLGYKELPKEGSFFVFINEDKKVFATEGIVIYTNKLNF